MTQERKRGSRGGRPRDDGEGVPSIPAESEANASEATTSLFSPPSTSRLDASVLPAPLSVEYIEVLEQYVPGAAARALTLVENEQRHRHAVDYKDINTQRLLIVVVAVALAGLIGGAIALGLRGQALSVAAILGGPAIGAVLSLGYGQLRARRNRRT